MKVRVISTPPAPEGLRFQAIHVAPWEGADGRHSYSVIGLTKDGRVYRYDAACDAWVAWSDRVATCTHKR